MEVDGHDFPVREAEFRGREYQDLVLSLIHHRPISMHCPPKLRVVEYAVAALARILSGQ